MKWDETGRVLVPDKTVRVTVNGEVHELHESIRLLTHLRAARLAGLPVKRVGNYNISVSYPDRPGLWFQLLPGNTASVVDDMYVEVSQPDKRWWEFWR